MEFGEGVLFEICMDVGVGRLPTCMEVYVSHGVVVLSVSSKKSCACGVSPRSPSADTTWPAKTSLLWDRSEDTHSVSVTPSCPPSPTEYMIRYSLRPVESRRVTSVIARHARTAVSRRVVEVTLAPHAWPSQVCLRSPGARRAWTRRIRSGASPETSGATRPYSPPTPRWRRP